MCPALPFTTLMLPGSCSGHSRLSRGPHWDRKQDWDSGYAGLSSHLLHCLSPHSFLLHKLPSCQLEMKPGNQKRGMTCSSLSLLLPAFSDMIHFPKGPAQSSSAVKIFKLSQQLSCSTLKTLSALPCPPSPSPSPQALFTCLVCHSHSHA